MYNGYPTQDEFHAAMRAAWAERLSTPEARERHNRDYAYTGGHNAACEHLDGICSAN